MREKIPDLSDVAVGMELVSGMGLGKRIEVVKNLTKTQIQVESGMKFNRNSGKQLGGTRFLRHPKECELEILRNEAMSNSVKVFRNWDYLSGDELQIIINIIQKY